MVQRYHTMATLNSSWGMGLGGWGGILFVVSFVWNNKNMIIEYTLRCEAYVLDILRFTNAGFREQVKKPS